MAITRPLLPIPSVTIIIACLNIQPAFINKLGDNEFSHMLAGILKENCISTDDVLFDMGARTALAFIALCSDDECEFMFCHNPKTDMLLKNSELNIELI
ncbi:carbohydrate kinase PfkB [Asimina triloba]